MQWRPARHGVYRGLQRYRCRQCGVATGAGIAHGTVNLQAGIRVNGLIHVQTVNSHHSRFKGWLRHFLGVASRYLPNYLGWRHVLDAGRVTLPQHFLRVVLMLDVV